MGSHSSQTPAKLIEPGLTVFSAAEIRVVSTFQSTANRLQQTSNMSLPCPSMLAASASEHGQATLHSKQCSLVQAVVPIGSIPEEVMQRYVSLIATHKQVSCCCYQHFPCRLSLQKAT